MGIARRQQRETIRRLLKQSPVVALLGARQVGKSALARDFIAFQGQASTFFDLEDERDLARLRETTHRGAVTRTPGSTTPSF